MGNRTILVKDDDKVVYDGPEQRHLQNIAVVQVSKLLGLTHDTWIKIAGFVFAVALFYYRTDDFIKSQQEMNKYIMQFTRNSDGYHSAITGQQFEQGQPNGRTISMSTRRALSENISAPSAG